MIIKAKTHSLTDHSFSRSNKIKITLNLVQILEHVVVVDYENGLWKLASWDLKLALMAKHF